MTRTLCVAVLFSALAACEAPSSAVRPPLVNEGEVYLYARPAAPGSGSLAVELETASALRNDGSQTALELREGAPSEAAVPRQRLLGFARLSPGSYAGLVLKIRRAALVGAPGQSELAVPTESVHVEGPFSVVQKRATVLWLGLEPEPGGSPAKLSLVQPDEALPARSAFVTSPEAGTVTVVERHSWQVLSVLEVPGEPAGVAFDDLQLKAYVARSAEDAVEILDRASGARPPPIQLRPGDHPMDLALTPDRSLLVVVNSGSATVSFVDPARGIELDRAQTGADPVSLTLDHLGRRAYVCNRTSGTVTVLDLPTHGVVATFGTEAQPIGLRLNRNGDHLFVAHAGSPYLSVFSVPGYALVGRYLVGLGVAGIELDTRTDLLYLGRRGSPQIEVYEPTTLLPVGFIDVPGPVAYMTIDDVENALLALSPRVGAVAIVDLSSQRPISVVEVTAMPARIAVAGERN